MPKPADAPANPLFRALMVLDRFTEGLEKLILGASVLFMTGLLVAHVLARQLFDSGVPGRSS